MSREEGSALSVAALGNSVRQDDAREHRLVDAAVIAEHLGVTRGYVYEHADELGARRLGTGPRARLRFSLEEVDERLSPCSGGRGSEQRGPAPQAGSSPRRRRRTGTSVDLLPIRGAERTQNRG